MNSDDMGFFRAIGTFSVSDWTFGSGGEPWMGRGVDGIADTGGTVVEGVLVGTERADDVGAGAVVSGVHT